MATNPQMYTAKSNEDGTWRVERPEGGIVGDGLTEQEAARLAYGYNVTFGYLKPDALSGEESQS